MPEMPKQLKVFLCHSSHDKPVVRELYHQLRAEDWIDPWLDEEKLYPGQDWSFEIEKAVEGAEVILVCLTKNSVNKEGYIQRELRMVLDLADYKPEGTLYVIPIRLEECDPPRRLRSWQYADYFPQKDRNRAYQRLLASLRMRAIHLGIPTVDLPEKKGYREAEGLIEHETLDKENLETEEKKREEVERLKIKAGQEQDQRVKDSPSPRKKIATDTSIKGIKSSAPSDQVLSKAAGNKFTLRPYAIGLGIFLGVSLGIFGIRSLIQNFTGTATPTARVTSAPVPTLGIGSQISSPKDSMVMVYVPAGEFPMGSDSGNADEKPIHKVYLDVFWIDRTEVTNAMYAKCVSEKQCDPPRSNGSSVYNSYYDNSEFGDYPVIYVSWNDAQKYCAWADRRLPTEAEWEKAARGENAFTFPWGNDAPNGDLLNFNGAVGDTTGVGKYMGGASPYDALDMAGNVWEWVNDRYAPNYYQNSPPSNPEGPSSGEFRVLRGGSWLYNSNFVRSASRDRNYPAYSSYDVGFRCARSE